MRKLTILVMLVATALMLFGCSQPADDGTKGPAGQTKDANQKSSDAKNNSKINKALDDN